MSNDLKKRMSVNGRDISLLAAKIERAETELRNSQISEVDKAFLKETLLQFYKQMTELRSTENKLLDLLRDANLKPQGKSSSYPSTHTC